MIVNGDAFDNAPNRQTDRQTSSKNVALSRAHLERMNLCLCSARLSVTEQVFDKVPALRVVGFGWC
jgi:hypothetical protein